MPICIQTEAGRQKWINHVTFFANIFPSYAGSRYVHLTNMLL